MTDEATPDADSRHDRNRVEEGRDDAPAADGGDGHGGDQHRRGQPVDPADRRAARDAVREDDVEREEGGVGEREGDADGLALELDVGEQVDAGHGERQREPVSRRPRAERRKRDDRQELDRGHSSERQPVDRHVEAAVHHREDDAEREEQRSGLAVESRARAPRPAPGGEDGARAGDPEPGHAEGVDTREEQHGKRGPEVVEDCASDEVGLRRRTQDGTAPARPAVGCSQRLGHAVRIASQAEPWNTGSMEIRS